MAALVLNLIRGSWGRGEVFVIHHIFSVKPLKNLLKNTHTHAHTHVHTHAHTHLERRSRCTGKDALEAYYEIQKCTLLCLHIKHIRNKTV